MSIPLKKKALKQYNVTISKLFELILDLNETHQEALLKKGQELLSKEKRAPRKSCRIPVRYSTFDRMYSDQIKNISQSGVFIETQRPIFVGEEILIELKMDGINKPFKIKGNVVHASQSGVGIRFKTMNPDFSNIMTAVLDHMKE
jgi:Tfp pilus assembly protein PilZ